MSVISGPNFINSGIVLHLDASNLNSYDSTENLFTNSNDFTTATWIAQPLTTSVVANTATIEAPNGTLTAWKVTATSTSSYFSIFRSVAITSNTNYSYSLHVKSAEMTSGSLTIYTTANNTVNFNLTNKTMTLLSTPDPNFTLNSYVLTDVENGWSRVSMNFRHSIDGTYQFKYNLPDNTTTGSGFYIWGAQIEKNNSASTYVATTSTIKTRGTSWRDLSGKNYHATLYNTPGFLNGSLQFRSSSNQYAISSFDEGVLKATNKLGSWTIEVLFNHAAVALTSESMLAGRSGCHGGIYQYNDNSLRHAIKTTETSCWTGALETTVGNLTTSSSYHTVMVYNSGVTNHYLNGSLVGTTVFNTSTYNITGYDNSFHIGGIYINPSVRYMTNSNVSLVKCYSRALTGVEVALNFNACRSRVGI
jgi:hypothetical protein